MMESFYLHFNSNLCDQTSNWEYFIYLPEYLECGPDYEIALTFCSYSHATQIRYFCTDLIEPQFLHDEKVRILKVLPPVTKNYRNLFTPVYVPMSKQSLKFNSFSIYIMSANVSRLSLKTALYGTLHIRKVVRH